MPPTRTNGKICYLEPALNVGQSAAEAPWQFFELTNWDTILF